MSEHERRHGGTKRAGQDVARWNERYAATDRLWSAEPNSTIAEIVGPWPAGTALDLGAGEGRHAVWMARRGWSVTAVDFSAVGLERGRRGARSLGAEVTWVEADVRSWRPPEDTAYDLVLIAYLHLDDDVLPWVRAWVRPGGRLLVLGHALRNLTAGVGGPQDPRLLHTEEQLRAAADGFEIERLGEVLRPTPEGEAVDVVLVARREA